MYEKGVIYTQANAMHKLTYGLFVLSVRCEKRDNACIINTALQVADGKIAISVNKANFTCEMLDYTDDFTVSTISEDADFALFERFGFHSGKDVEKFDGFDDCERIANGTLAVTKGTNSYISAHIVEKTDLGTHMMFIAEVTDKKVISDTPSASYAYYQSNIKPRPKKNSDGKVVWRCSVCGYEYVGDELPDGFICPLCKHGKEDFEKVLN